MGGENVCRRNIDTAEFIKEIKQHQCIWNYKSGEHGCKEERAKVWTELCRKFSKNYDEMDKTKQLQVSMQLQRKWKTLRDCFMRFVDQKRKSAPGTGPKTYIYYNQLSFLLKLCKRTNVESKNNRWKFTRKPQTYNNFTESAEPNTSVDTMDASSIKLEIEPYEPLGQGSTAVHGVAYQSDDPLENQMMQARVASQTQISTTEFDEDKCFLLSLCTDFKNIPDEWKLDAKTEILEVLRKYRFKVSGNQ